MSCAVFFVYAQDNGIGGGKELFEHIRVFADSMILISSDYVEPVDIKKLVYGAIRGMTGILDGYSQFLDPGEFKDINEDAKGLFGGIGIEIGILEGALTVITPIEDTPAFEAGIISGDEITGIDGETTLDMTLDDASKKLRGAPGTEVTVTIERSGAEEPLDFKITRAIIKFRSIKESRMLEDGIGYIKLLQFQERTPADLKKAMQLLVEKGALDLVIDVRNNPGGLLEAAIEVADYFLEPGTMIVYIEGRDPKERIEFRAKNKMDFTELNLIILVNNGSASASEILAGAIKDNKRGFIVGIPTFGKGSVQTVFPLKDGSALKLTTAAYFTPSGINLRDKGVEPDVFVEQPADRPKEDDLQLKAAINIFKGLEIFDNHGSDGPPSRSN